MRGRFMKGSTMRAEYRRIFRSANPLLRLVRIASLRNRAGLRNRKDNSEADIDYTLLFVALVQLPAGVISYLLSPGLNVDLLICALVGGLSSIALELFTGRLNSFVSTTGLLAINVSLGIFFAELVPIWFMVLGSPGMESFWFPTFVVTVIPIVCTVAMFQDLEYANKLVRRGRDQCLASALSCSLFFALGLPFVWIARAFSEASRRKH